MNPGTRYQIRNLPRRVRPAALKAELYDALGIGLRGRLRAVVLRYEPFRDACLDLKEFALLDRYVHGTPLQRDHIIEHCKHDPRFQHCLEDLGTLGKRVVTTAGVNFLTDAFQNTVEIEAMNYHDAGTGVAAEAVGDTTLGTPWGGSRVAGTQGEGASANIYQTVATINFTGTFAITEHGIFSAATSGTLWDRTVFSQINVNNGDSIQFTYELTSTAGG